MTVPLISVVTYMGVQPARRAIYAVDPAHTTWDALHSVATVTGLPLTPVLLRDGLQIRIIPPWLHWLFHPSAFTVPGTIYLNPMLPMVPVELLVHEHVHDFRAQQGGLQYLLSIVTGVLVGAVRAIRYGGTPHEWSPVEIEARIAARDICTLYGDSTTAPLDAPAQVAAYFAGTP